jgi:urease accessory protein
MRRARPGLLGLSAIGISVIPASAHAHLVVTGMGPLFDGISHFALSPEDFLPVIALAFFAGLRGPRHARTLSWTIPLAWFGGGVLALMPLTPPEITLSAMTAVLFLVVGGLLAVNPALSVAACLWLGVVVGLVRGMADLVNVQKSPAHILTLIGIVSIIFVTSAIAASMTLPLKRLWGIVVARVCGSWLAALGLLLAGWLLRYGDVVR